MYPHPLGGCRETMRGAPKATALAIVVVACLLVGGAGNVSALTLGVEVIVTAPQRLYAVGDTVTLTVSVFEQGVPTDASNLSVTAGNYSAARNLTTTRTGTGVYAATYQILASDLVASLSYTGLDEASIAAVANVSGVSDVGRYYLVVEPPTPPPFAVWLGVSTGETVPGASFGVTAEVFRDGVLTDPDSLTIGLQSYGGGSTTLTAQREAIGLYFATYSVPRSITETTYLSVEAQATFGQETLSNQTVVVVRPARTFITWYSEGATNNTTAVANFHVANETGWPVAGAVVNVTYAEYGCGGYTCKYPRSLEATTDRFGAVAFLFVSRSPPAPWPLYFGYYGTVTKGVIQTNLSGLTSGYYAYGLGAFAYQLDPYRTFLPGTTANATFAVATPSWAAVHNAVYYAYTEEAVLAAGNATLDAHGDFEISFTMPPEPVYLLVAENVRGTWYYNRGSVLPRDVRDFQVGPVAIGGVTPITISLPPGVLTMAPAWSATVTAAFMAYNTSSPSGLAFSWMPASGLAFWDEVGAASVPMVYHMVIPRFLPKDRTYALIIGVGPAPGWLSPVYTDIRYFANEPPIAAARFSSQNLVQGETVDLNASVSTDPDGMIAAYAWDWGDGSSTNWSVNATGGHAYPTPGVYTVTVRVRDDSGAVNATTYTVTVDAAVFGIRSSVFWTAVILAAAAAVAAAVYVVWRRRRPRNPDTVPEKPA